jgi:DnaJ-domain-containing protein 1
MTIGRRLFNMARSELNSLLDRAVEAERQSEMGSDPDEDLYRRFSLDQLTDAELEAEIERRYRARQSARGADTHPPAGTPSASRPASKTKASSTRPSGTAHPRKTTAPDELRLAYAALEVPFGSDFATVRKSYRTLMRKYHPDRHAGSPDKQKAATELAQKLSAAYQLIEHHARG